MQSSASCYVTTTREIFMEPNLSRAARRSSASAPRHKPKQFLRKADVAQRYGVNARTVSRMAEDGRIPPPTRMNGRIPLWSEDALDRADEAAEAALREAAS
jgi:hypothetical protein